MIESFLRSLPKQNRLIWLLAFLSIAFLISATWLGFAVSRGVRSNDWTETKGVIAGRPFGLGHPRARRFRWRCVKVDYSFDDRPLSRFVSVFATGEGVKPGNSISIFVNPDRPTELASAPGFLAIDYGPPLASTLGLLAAIAVTLCIKLSPKDDYESEVNETLM
jgi:hypothetical protein